MKDLWERADTLLNLAQYAQANGSLECGRLDLAVPEEPQMVLRMPVIMPEYGNHLLLPSNLEWTLPLMARATLEQMGASAPFQPFVYLTVRSGPVSTITDDEWHVDGFSMRTAHIPQQSFVWSSDGGTQEIVMPMNIPKDFDPLQHNLMHFIKHEAERQNPEVVDMCAKHVYAIDPYCIHRRSPTCAPVRTFVRVSFLPIRIEDSTCTVNPLYEGETPAFENRVQTFRDTLKNYHKECKE